MKTQLTSDDPAGWYECQMKSDADVLARFWNGRWLYMDSSQATRCDCQYTNFRRLYTEGEVLEAGATLLLQQKEIEALKAGLDRLKSQPYPMRRADKPDCVGLWRNNIGYYIEVADENLTSYWPYHPYYYLGPIPVVPKEQLPPKVVTIMHQGKPVRAIPSDNPEFWTLLGDNGISCGVAVGKFEEVQS